MIDLRVKPAPGRPQCVDADPAIFETDLGPTASATSLAALAMTAIRTYCLPCRVRAWCLETVNPRPSGFTGVAGGVLWRNGYAVPYGPPELGPPPELPAYLDGPLCAK